MNILWLKTINTGEIYDNVFAIKTTYVNFFIVKSKDEIICVDSGCNSKKIIMGLKEVNVEPEKITHLFLTHTDYDHTAGIELFRNAKIYLAKEEEQMINGTTVRFLGFRYNNRIEKDYRVLEDGEKVNIGETTVKCILTPGHTPGSMCYLIDDKLLFVGDTINLKKDKVVPFMKVPNMDTETQKKSIKKLVRLKCIEIVCTAHSGYTKNFEEAICDWR